MAQDFNLKRFHLSGVPKLVVAEELESDPAFSWASFSVSKSGIVVFQSAADNLSRLTWFDREGNELEVIPATGYSDPSLSRDGTLLAVSSDDERNGKHYIRVYDFGRATSTRVSAGGADTFPAISPDGKSVAYLNGMKKRISVVATDNASPPEDLIEEEEPIPNDWSSDGRHLIYMSFQQGLPELATYDFRRRTHETYAEAATEAQFSPDGKWVAYTAPSISGAANYFGVEVFVAPFPGPGGRIQISTQGGGQARWRADGKELFYIGNEKKLMAVSINFKDGKLIPGGPHVLFQTKIIAGARSSFPVCRRSEWKALSDQQPSGGRRGSRYRTHSLIRIRGHYPDGELSQIAIAR
jgi:dipeptidyl aminopeptidase/acylaminoacyl peptidase